MAEASTLASQKWLELQRNVAFVASLKNCAKQKDVHRGSRLHADIVQMGLHKTNIFIGNALVNMYAKCGELSQAQDVFDELSIRDTISWTTLITGYARNGHGKEALECLERMQDQGISPDAMTFPCLLKACGSIRAVEKGEELYAQIVREGLLENDVVLITALLDMYAKCGTLSKAQELFDKLPVRTVVSWTALIAGYVQHGHGKDALNCYEQMKFEGHSPDAVTFASILKACGSTGAAEKGTKVHAEIMQEGLLLNDSVLSTAVVDMYAKCGALAKAQQVFDELFVWNVASWNALIAGYSHHGDGKEALRCFERMQLEGMSPNMVTFLCILSACSCAGLLDEAQVYFEMMIKSHGIIPNLEHYTCMVDLFSRRGQFEEAMAMVNKMPCTDYFPLWVVLLTACQKWGSAEGAKLAFHHAI